MLDVRDYDLALVDRIKTFYGNTHWINKHIIPIKEIRDQKLLNGCEVDFPIITVRRTNCPLFSKEYNSWSRANAGQTYVTGQTPYFQQLKHFDPELATKITSGGHYDIVSVVNSTFELTYYIDVISFERDNFDTLMIELQENLFRVPYIGFFNIKSDGTQDKLVKEQACHLIVEEVEDASDLENFDSGNAMYRGIITVKVNAYIYRKYKEKAVEKFSNSFMKQYFDGSNNGNGSGNGFDDIDYSYLFEGQEGMGLVYVVDKQAIKSNLKVNDTNNEDDNKDNNQ